MTSKVIRPLALFLGVGALAACNGDDMVSSATDTETGTETDTDTDGTSTTATTTTTTTMTTTATTTTTTTTTTSTSETTTTVGPTTDPTDTDTDTSTTEPADTLCDRLGGETGINELHTNFVGKVVVDEQINAYFLNSDVDGGNLISCLNKQIGEAAGCDGVVYDCLDMLTAHAGMGISTQDFTDLATDYSLALDDHQGTYPTLTDDDKMGILTILGGMAPDIVEDADNNLTVYQRVGRKPAIKTLIGKPGEAMSFVDIVANNAAINGFFGASNFDRLNTCLTRQVASIDGPAVYGGEVDSPAAGIDDGVALADPCKDMMTSHAGLMDMNDNSLIMFDDFTALVGDLVTAMNNFAVDQADQDAILGALGPLCDQIVADSPNDCPGNTEVLVVESLDNAVDLTPIDDDYNGTEATMACLELMVDDNGVNFVKDVKLTIGLAHTWVGDLVIKVFSPAGTAITVLSRPIYAEAADNGVGIANENSNMSVDFPINFFDLAPNDAEQLGAGIGQDQIVCKDDAKCDWKPNAGAATPGTFANLLNESSVGTWKVCVGDGGPGDFGTFDDATLEITKVKFMMP